MLLNYLWRTRPTNEAITAKTVMLVLEKADGSTETTVVSRKQALDAARIANLDLVQGETGAEQSEKSLSHQVRFVTCLFRTN